MKFAMLVALGMSDPSWTYVHSDTLTTTSSPNTSTGGYGGSAAAAFSPPFLTFASLFCASYLEAAFIRINVSVFVLLFCLGL